MLLLWPDDKHNFPPNLRLSRVYGYVPHQIFVWQTHPQLRHYVKRAPLNIVWTATTATPPTKVNYGTTTATTGRHRHRKAWPACQTDCASEEDPPDTRRVLSSKSNFGGQLSAATVSLSSAPRRCLASQGERTWTLPRIVITRAGWGDGVHQGVGGGRSRGVWGSRLKESSTLKSTSPAASNWCWPK